MPCRVLKTRVNAETGCRSHGASKICVYVLNMYQGCDFNHFLTTVGMGHAAESPLSFVRSYICSQHSYNFRSCMSHLDWLYVFLFKHAWRLQAAPVPQGDISSN